MNLRHLDKINYKPCVAACLFFIMSCAVHTVYTPQEDLTRDQFLEMTYRDYPNLTEDQGWDALELLLQSISYGEMSVAYSKTEIRGSRRVGDLQRSGAHVFTYVGRVEALSDAGIRLSLDVWDSYMARDMMFGGASLTSGPAQDGQISDKATYIPLFERFEFYAGVARRYPSCEGIELRQKSGELTGSAGSICYSVYTSIKEYNKAKAEEEARRKKMQNPQRR